MNSLVLDIAAIFSEKRFTWGLGGSLVLKRYGITDSVKDIDILIVPEEYSEAEKQLAAMGTKIPVQPHKKFKSQKYSKYVIKGFEVDLISDFQIVTELGLYSYPFDTHSITKRDYFAQGSVNYTSVEDWYVLYLLMERSEDKKKLEAITNYFRINKITHKDLLRRSLKAAPKRIKLLAMTELNIDL
jgi:hypothetical protein